MPFLNFKIVNAKNLKLNLKKLLKYGISVQWNFNYQLAHRDIKEALWKKTRAIKLKIQKKHITLTNLLMFSPEFCTDTDIQYLSSHTWIKIKNLNICRQVKEEIKGVDICYTKRNCYHKIEQKHITYISMLLNTAIIRIF